MALGICSSRKATNNTALDNDSASDLVDGLVNDYVSFSLKVITQLSAQMARVD
jgi:hypothetical protein